MDSDGVPLYFNRSARRVGYAFSNQQGFDDFLMNNPASFDCIDEATYLSLADINSHDEVLFLSIDHLLYKKDMQGVPVKIARLNIRPISTMIAMSHADYIKKNPLFKYEYGYIQRGSHQVIGIVLREFRAAEIFLLGPYRQHYQIPSQARSSPGGKLIFTNISQFKRGELYFEIVECNEVTFLCPDADTFIDTSSSPRTSLGSSHVTPTSGLASMPSSDLKLAVPLATSTSTSSNISTSMLSNVSTSTSSNIAKTDDATVEFYSKSNSISTTDSKSNPSSFSSSFSNSMFNSSSASKQGASPPFKKPINGKEMAAVSTAASKPVQFDNFDNSTMMKRVNFIDGPSDVCKEKINSNAGLGRPRIPRTGPALAMKANEVLDFNSRYKENWDICKGHNKWKVLWPQISLPDTEFHYTPHSEIKKKVSSEFYEKVEALGIENLEYFHTRKAFLGHLEENPCLVRSWAVISEEMQKQGWVHQELEPSSNESFYEKKKLSKGSSTEYFFYYLKVAKKDLVPGLHAFNNRLAAIQYINRFPFLLQDDEVFCKTIQRYRWVAKSSRKRGDPEVYHLAQQPGQCYTLDQIREESWKDPWFLLQSYSDIGRDGIIEAVKIPEHFALEILKNEPQTPDLKTPAKVGRKSSKTSNKMEVDDDDDDDDDDNDAEEEEEEEDDDNDEKEEEDDTLAMETKKSTKISKEEIEQKRRLNSANKRINDFVELSKVGEVNDENDFKALLVETGWEILPGTFSSTDEWWKNEIIYVPFWSPVHSKNSHNSNRQSTYQNGVDFFFSLDDIMLYIEKNGNQAGKFKSRSIVGRLTTDYCNMDLDKRLQLFSNIDNLNRSQSFERTLFHKYLELSGWQRIPLDQKRNVYIPYWNIGEITKENYLNSEVNDDYYVDIAKVANHIKKFGNQEKPKKTAIVVNLLATPYERIKQFLELDPKVHHIFNKTWDELKELGWRSVYAKVRTGNMTSLTDVFLPAWNDAGQNADKSKTIDLTDAAYVSNMDYFLTTTDVLAYIRKHKTIEQAGDGASPAKLPSRRQYTSNVTFKDDKDDKTAAKTAAKTGGGKAVSSNSSNSSSNSMDVQSTDEPKKKKSPGRPKSPKTLEMEAARAAQVVIEAKQLDSKCEFNQEDDLTIHVPAGSYSSSSDVADPDMYRTDLSAEQKAWRKEVLDICHVKNPNFYAFPKIKDNLVKLGWKMNAETTTGGTVTLPPWTELTSDNIRKSGRVKISLGLMVHGRDYFNDSKDVTHYIQKHGMDSTLAAATPMERLSKKGSSSIVVPSMMDDSSSNYAASRADRDTNAAKAVIKTGGAHQLKRLSSTDSKDLYLNTVPLEGVQVNARGNKYRVDDNRLAVSSAPVSPAHASMGMSVTSDDGCGGLESPAADEEDDENESDPFIEELQKVHPNFEFIWECLSDLFGWSCESASRKTIDGLVPPSEIVEKVYYRVGTKDRKLRGENLIIDEDYFYSTSNLLNYVKMQYGIINTMVNEKEQPRATRNNPYKNSSESVKAIRDIGKRLKPSGPGAKRSNADIDEAVDVPTNEAKKLKAQSELEIPNAPEEILPAPLPIPSVRWTLQYCMQGNASNNNSMLIGRENEIGILMSSLEGVRRDRRGSKCILIHGATGQGKSSVVGMVTKKLLSALESEGFDVSDSCLKILCTTDPNPMASIAAMLDPSSSDGAYLQSGDGKLACRARIVERLLDPTKPPLVVVLDELDRCNKSIIKDILMLTQVEKYNIIVIGTSNTISYVDKQITDHPATRMMPFAPYSKEQIISIIERQARGLLEKKAAQLLAAKCVKHDSDLRRVFDVLNQGYNYLLKAGSCDLNAPVSPLLTCKILQPYYMKVFGEDTISSGVLQLNAVQRKVLVSLVISNDAHGRTMTQLYHDFQAYTNETHLPNMYVDEVQREVEILLTLSLMECNVTDEVKRRSGSSKAKYITNTPLQVLIDCARMESVHKPYLLDAKRKQDAAERGSDMDD